HYFLIGQHRPQRQMCILREVMPPGTDTGDSMLLHEGEEGGVVIEGEVEVTVGDQVRILRAGEAYYFESKVPHRFRNTGENDAVIFSANTPATF
ncbi:MAG: cupin domain-containing protein, partial [Oxalobacteraceae bacterium]